MDLVTQTQTPQMLLVTFKEWVEVEVEVEVVG